jgi:hypothetical protein
MPAQTHVVQSFELLPGPTGRAFVMTPLPLFGNPIQVLPEAFMTDITRNYDVGHGPALSTMLSVLKAMYVDG